MYKRQAPVIRRLYDQMPYPKWVIAMVQITVYAGAIVVLDVYKRQPMLQCNLKFYENLDETKFEALIAELRTKAAAPEPSVVERIIGYAEER